MTKLMFLGWGDPARLFEAALRVALADAGATMLQVNAADEPVAGGMRLEVYDEPITSVTSVWTDAEAVDVGPIASVLEGATEQIVGWAVSSEEPITPRMDQVQGERLDAMANFALLRIPEGLAREDWLRIWKVDHTPVGIATQGTFGYVQNIPETLVVDTTDGSTPHPDAFVEEHFPMAALTDIHEFYGSAGDKAELSRRMTVMMESVARFGADRNLDLVPTSRYLWQLS